MKFVFIGCMGRSGSTLLRLMLDCHSTVAAGPEFNYLPNFAFLYKEVKGHIERGRIDPYLDKSRLKDVFSNFIGSIFQPYLEQQGKTIFAEKSPSNIWGFEILAEILPDSKFIYLFRDPRDVVASHLRVGKRFQKQNKPLDSPSLGNAFICAREWTRTMNFASQVCGDASSLSKAGRCLSVRYEDLVLQSEESVNRICQFLELEFEPRMLRPHAEKHDVVVDNLWFTEEQYTRPISPSAIGGWERGLNLHERLLVATACQPMLTQLGYVESLDWITKGLNVDQQTLDKQVALANEEAKRLSES